MNQVSQRPPNVVRVGGAVIALLIALLVAAGVPGLRTVAAQDPASPIETDATVRIVHGSPDAGTVDVLLDGQPVAPGLLFGAATQYLPVPPGDHQVQVVPAGGGQPLVDGTVTVESGTAYEVAAVGPVSGIQLQAYEVNLDGIENAGQARVRVIHAVADAPAVDVAIAGGDPIIEGVEFPNGSDYVEVDAGTYDLEVRNAESDAVLLPAPGVVFEAGQVYDIFALGQGQTIQLLPLSTAVSPPCSQTLGIGQPSDACLRVVHASQDAGPVDVYLGEAPVVQGLEFGLATEFAPAASGEQQVRVVPAGGPLDQPAIDATQELTAGQAYQVIATGAADDFQAVVNEMDLSPLPANQARMRVIHASPDTDAIDVAIAGGPVPFENIEYRGASGYQTLDAGTYSLQVRTAEDDTILLEAVDTMIEAGKVYDVVAIGRGEDATLQAVVLVAAGEVRAGQAATPIAGTPVPAAAPAAPATPVVAVGASPVVETPGAATPAATPAGTPAA